MEKALLVTVKLESEKDSWQINEIAAEFEQLVYSCNIEVTKNVMCKVKFPSADVFIGKGKTQEIALLAKQNQVNTVIFSHDISGTQQRNLEDVIGKKTIDRTQLILDIFSQHAKSQEGKTQVELAQLQYLLPRLVGKGIILSRLGGGIGTRGPGERKLEVDRRKIRKRIDKLKKDLAQLSNHRKTIRKKRKDENIISLALVGYTNAGKSSLLNCLTQSSQDVRDSLFTTLDPLAKSFKLPNGVKVIISDTVGFLNDLPHHLVEAFKATLEDVQEADMLIHVLDASSPLVYQYRQSVFRVLRELNSDKKSIITALNKIDLLDDRSWLERLKMDFKNSFVISAKYNQNIDLLIRGIELKLQPRLINFEKVIPLSRMDLIDLFYREGKVKAIDYTTNGIKIKADLPKVLVDKLLKNKEL